MPNVQEGLETGEQRDVNSDAGFLAALASQVGAEVPEGQLAESESHDTSVAAGLTTEESPNRDERGRFAPAAAPEEGAAPAEEEHAEEDPELAEFLGRHGGDSQAALAAALREAREAQSLIGRQGNDLGQERQARQELAERLARLEGMAQANVPLPVPAAADEAVVEGLESMYAQHGGAAMMNWVANNRPDLIDAAERVWISEDQIGGLDYRARRVAYETMYEGQRTASAPQADPFLDQMRRERAFNTAIDGVRSSMTPQEWNTVREHLVPALEDQATPDIIKRAVVSNDPEEQKQGMSALVDRAWRRAAATATSQAQNARNEQVRSDKLRAQVATGSLRPVQERKPVQEMSTEERTKLFHEALLSTETTSVRDGLTYGK